MFKSKGVSLSKAKSEPKINLSANDGLKGKKESKGVNVKKLLKL